MNKGDNVFRKLSLLIFCTLILYGLRKFSSLDLNSKYRYDIAHKSIINILIFT